MKTLRVRLLLLLVLGAAGARSASSQTGPTFYHSDVLWRDPKALLWVDAEKKSIYYLNVDLYVTLNVPFRPMNIPPLGNLLIHPGAVVYARRLVLERKVLGQPWSTVASFYYPRMSYQLIGVKFRVQIVAYDATNKGRMVFSTNYALVKVRGY